jgi:hypothetical protein
MESSMAADERDRRFDKALARHLRSAAPTGEAANRSTAPLSPCDACPDAETLAAYHQRSLLPKELNSWKSHLVGCARCQAILAHLESTDQIPLSHSHVATPIDASQPPKTRVPRPSFRPRWQWLAPAGAMAAGLLVWVALHENQPRFQVSSEVKTAKVEPPSTTPPPASAPAGTPPPKPALTATEDYGRTSRESASLDQKVAGEKKAAADEELSRQNKELSATLRKPSSQIAVPERGRAGALRDAAKASRNDKDQVAAVGGATQSVTVEAAKPESDALAATDAQVQIQTQAANLPVQNQNISPAPSGPAQLGQATGAMKAKAAPAAPAPPPKEPAANMMRSSTALEVVAVTDPRLILAPGSSTRWRVGPAGLIQFSANGGASWSRQASGVLADLLTGSAPSDKVCWIVGRLGAILLTTDGGAHWKLLSSPMKDELGGVQASDALHARVWNSRNTKSFETSDGGVTWKRFVNE